MGFITNKTAFSVFGNCVCSHAMHNKSYIQNNRYKVISKGIALTSTYSWDVYHSLIESLPKLMHFYINNTIINNYDVIISKSKYKTSPIFEILLLLGIKKSNIVITPLIAKELIIPFPSTCLQGIEKNVKILSGLIIDKIRNNSNLTKRKVLILKRSKKYRNFSNFTAIYDLIENFYGNFTIEIYDDKIEYEYKKILMMFYEASIVIGVHGAGLSNIIACRPETVIIEIVTKNNFKCYQSLSHQLDLKYINYVYNKSETNFNAKFLNINISDFHQFLYQVKI